jgi:hypothetical protein
VLPAQVAVLEVVFYAQEHRNIASGRKFDVDEMIVRQWPGEEEKVEGNSKIKYPLCKSTQN